MFGNSPDETAYFRISLMREAVPDALLAIQPSLLAYTLDQPVQVWHPSSGCQHVVGGRSSLCRCDTQAQAVSIWWVADPACAGVIPELRLSGTW